MNISAVSSALSAVTSYTACAPGSLAQAISVEMLDKTMEMTEAMNTKMLQQMEHSVTPHLGGNVDLYV